MTGNAPWGPAGEPNDPRHGAVDPRGPYHEFARRVRGRHYWILGTPLCACTQPALLCPDLRDAHTLFGDHVPWRAQDTLPLRPPMPLPAPRPGPRPAPHRVQFRPPPRPYRGKAVNRLWPWETKRLGPHHWVTRPWRPDQDPRVRAVAATVVSSAVVVEVWHLQGDESGTAAHGSAASLAAGLMAWGWRAWRR